jgi:cell wall-associated NlpC family hydrolase
MMEKMITQRPGDPEITAFFDTEEKQAAIAQAALGWVGTRFAPYGMTKGKGTDCIRLIATLLEEAGAIPAIDWEQFPRYTLDWSSHHTRPILEEAIEFLQLQYLRIETMAELQPGDVLAFAPGKVVYHLGIYTGAHSFVHAMREAGVIRTTLSHPTLQRHFRYAMRPAMESVPPESDLRPTTSDLRPEKE